MDQPRHVLILRIAAVVFSIALAMTYIACRSGYGASDGKNPSDPPSDPAVLPPTKSAPVSPQGNFLPGSKSSGVILPGSKSTPVSPDLFPGSKSGRIDPSFLPGSKSIIVEPPGADGHTKPKYMRLKNIPDPLREIEKGDPDQENNAE